MMKNVLLVRFCSTLSVFESPTLIASLAAVPFTDSNVRCILELINALYEGASDSFSRTRLCMPDAYGIQSVRKHFWKRSVLLLQGLSRLGKQ